MRVCQKGKMNSLSAKKWIEMKRKNTVVSYIKVTNIEAGLNGLNRERMAREVNMESSGEFQEMNVDAGLES